MKNPKALIGLLICGGLWLSGCSTGATAISAEPTLLRTTPSPHPEQTAATSATAVITNAFQKWTLQQVLDAFSAAELEVGEIQRNDPSDLAGAPRVASEFAFFHVPSRGVDAGGLIFVFSSEADMQSVYKYYKDSGWYDNGLYYPWVYRKDNILLQINGILSKVQADKYGAALEQLR